MKISRANASTFLGMQYFEIISQKMYNVIVNITEEEKWKINQYLIVRRSLSKVNAT